MPRHTHRERPTDDTAPGGGQPPSKCRLDCKCEEANSSLRIVSHKPAESCHGSSGKEHDGMGSSSMHFVRLPQTGEALFVNRAPRNREVTLWKVIRPCGPGDLTHRQILKTTFVGTYPADCRSTVPPRVPRSRIMVSNPVVRAKWRSRQCRSSPARAKPLIDASFRSNLPTSRWSGMKHRGGATSSS